MSISHNKRRKVIKALRSIDEKSLRRRIRSGELPQSYFAKSGDRLETEQHPRKKAWRVKTWRLVDTLSSLLIKEEEEKREGSCG